MAGIAAGWACDENLSHLLLLFGVSVVAMLSGLLRSTPKWLFGAGVMAFMFAVGCFAEHQQAVEKAPRWGNILHKCTARLVETPDFNGTSVKVLADLSVVDDTIFDGERMQGLVYLYFMPTVDTENLKAGDVVDFNAVVSSPQNPGNPAEFDIENYYYIKNITGSAFVYMWNWSKLPAVPNGLKVRALKFRAGVIALYERLGFSGKELALLSALTLGEKRELPQDLKENFSAAGGSHVLALSGLHLGILYMLLAIVLPFSGLTFKWRVFREFVIVALLWEFVFIAGLSPSVVRAAILFTLMSFGRLIGQDVSPVSSLSFAAIVMLLFSPHLLFDVSFQLSYAAVFAILLLAPPLQRVMRVHEHGAVYGYVANVLILSLVAQAGTFPFVWYYFGAFPLYFLLTNLLVVPLAFVVMSLAVAVWMLVLVPFLQQYVAWLLLWVIRLMDMGVTAIAELPGASVIMPDMGLFGPVCVVALMLLLITAFTHRRRWLTVFSICCTLLFAVLFLFATKEKEKGDYMVIYNNRTNPLLHVVYDEGPNYLLSTVPQLDARYEYASTPFVRREKLEKPVWAENGYCDSLLHYKDGGFLFNGLKVKMLDNRFWRESDYVFPVDILVLCRGFLGPVKELLEVYPAACVVLDASLYKHSRVRIKREYAKLGVEVVDITETGAMKVVASSDGFELIEMRE